MLLNSLKYLRPENIINNLNRNISYILNDKPKTPSINLAEGDSDLTSTFNKDLIRYNYPDEKYKYDLLLLENTNGENLSMWLINKNNKANFNTEIWNIIFQISAGCYAMSLSKMVHNDLHASNIFIQELETYTNFLYNIDDIPMMIRTKYKVLIFDFDRAYVKRFGFNNILTDKSCKKISQCNIFIENKDIVKIFCYIAKITNKNELLDLLTTNSIIQNIMETVYDHETEGVKKCFLQYKENTALPVSIYDSINSTSEILNKIYEKYLNKYDPEDMESVNVNNVYTCSSNMFDLDGNIIKSGLDGNKKLKAEKILKKNKYF
jgi:hypothetical protein